MPSDSSTYMPSPSPSPESRGKASQPNTPKKRKDKERGGDNAPWTSQHSNIVRLGLLRAAYAGRTSIYTLPGLIGEVDGHGNDRIIKQIQKELKAIATAWDLDVTMADIKTPSQGGSSGGGGAGSSPKRRVGCAASRVGSPSKKAKIKAEVDVDSEVE